MGLLFCPQTHGWPNFHYHKNLWGFLVRIGFPKNIPRVFLFGIVLQSPHAWHANQNSHRWFAFLVQQMAQATLCRSCVGTAWTNTVRFGRSSTQTWKSLTVFFTFKPLLPSLKATGEFQKSKPIWNELSIWKGLPMTTTSFRQKSNNPKAISVAQLNWSNRCAMGVSMALWSRRLGIFVGRLQSIY